MGTQTNYSETEKKQRQIIDKLLTGKAPHSVKRIKCTDIREQNANNGTQNPESFAPTVPPKSSELLTLKYPVAVSVPKGSHDPPPNLGRTNMSNPPEYQMIMYTIFYSLHKKRNTTQHPKEYFFFIFYSISGIIYSRIYYKLICGTRFIGLNFY